MSLEGRVVTGVGRRLGTLLTAALVMTCLLAATVAPPAAVAACTGDCDGDGAVTVDDLLTMVNVALENTPVGQCAAGDADGDHAIAIDEILIAVNYALTSCPATQPVSLVTGDYALTVGADARTLTLSRRDEVLLAFPADAFQLGTVDTLDERSSYDPYFLESHGPLLPASLPASLQWRTVARASVASAAADTVVVQLRFDDGRGAALTLSVDAPGRFTATLVPELPSGAPAIAWMRLRPRASSTEAFYGLGEWEDDVNHRGKSRPMQIELQPDIESLYNEDHVPVPLLIGARGWGLFVESRRLGEFDVATHEADLVEVTYGTAQQSGDGLRFHLFAAEHPLDITKHYYDLTGYPLLPAPWALGPWIWRNENRDQQEVLDDIDTIRTLDLATSAIWIDRPYASAVNTFDFNPSQFPDPASMIATAHANGLRLALWHAPYVEPAAEPVRSEALANNYFPPTSGLLLNSWSKPIDFSNPAAYAWWQDLIRRYTDMGIEGFKLDYGEDIAPGIQGKRNVWKFFDGSDERTMHYGYTLLYHQVYAETLPASGGFLLCRAGRWGDQRNVSVVWPGDMDATFTRHGEPYVDHSGQTKIGVGGLPATVAMGLGLGPSGFPFFGADTGGYKNSPPGKELYIRWFEQTALSSVMQVGDSSSQPPWVFTADNGRDQETLDLYRIYARLHLRLFPYEWTYARNIAADGRPIQRALGLAYPQIGQHPSDEYLFGDDLLVAPVIEAGATARHVIVPPGEWIDWWDGTLYSGGAAGGVEVDVPAPLSKLPLFVRAGGIVPLLRPTIDTLSPTTLPAERVESYANDAGVLYVRVVPGDSASAFALFDSTRMSQAPVAGGNDLTFHGGQTFTKGAMLEVLRVPVIPQAVTRNGSELGVRETLAVLEAADDGWFWEPALGGTLWVKLPGGDDQQVTVR
jgi:alpha-D-xyloside xylohydrolase